VWGLEKRNFEEDSENLEGPGGSDLAWRDDGEHQGRNLLHSNAHPRFEINPVGESADSKAAGGKSFLGR
jgi:hypothetical protein